MMRILIVPALLVTAALLSMPADAQRRGAEISQGVTSGQMAETTEQLRLANAELGARLTGLEADRAALNGQVETLEFLLSQSRDQINQMQADDAEIGRLIDRLDRQLEDQASRIDALEGRLAVSDAARNDVNAKEMGIEPLSGEAGLSQGLDTGKSDEDQFEAAGTAAAAGPTRIGRAAPASDLEEKPDALPQGTLGTLSASALPGQAGPLFAEAKSRLLQFDYAGAEAAFRSFLDQFGDDPQAGEAQYWLGEVLYQQDAYAASGQAYTQMIRQYPEDPRAPEALAKLARSMRLIGDTTKACNALNILPQRYPDASGVTRNLAAGERVRSGCDT